jgi:hypothetical protein
VIHPATVLPPDPGLAGGEEAVTVARWGRRRTVLAAVAVIGVLAVGTGVVLVGFSTGGGSSGVATVAPVHPSPGLVEKGVPMDGGAGVYSERAAGSDARSVAPPQSAAPDEVPGLSIDTVQRELVRTAQISVEVTDPAASSRQVRFAAAGVNGFVTEEQSSETGGLLVLRVPADALDRLVDDIAAVGRVVGRSSQVLDATEEVVDLDARVASQQAGVVRVRALLAEAVSISDVVAIESELARREADLDSLTSRLEALRDRVALSTLTVDLRSPGVPPVGDQPPAGFRDGLAAGWDGLRAAGTAAAAIIGFLLPFLPVVAMLVGIIWLARRVVRTRRAPAAASAGGRSGPGSEGES